MWRGGKPFYDLVRTLDERIWIGQPACQDRYRGHRRPGHVSRKLNIDRQRTLTRVSQDAGDFVGRCRHIGQHCLVTGDLTIHRQLSVHRTHLMMKNEAACTLARTRGARDHDNGRAFGIGVKACSKDMASVPSRIQW